MNNKRSFLSAFSPSLSGLFINSTTESSCCNRRSPLSLPLCLGYCCRCCCCVPNRMV